MPAKRLPWIKFWPEAVDHEKFAALGDGEAWTWVVVWAKASQQAIRWRFASVEHAAKVTGRPAKHIRKLIEARLIDERSDGLWMHNAAKWQDRYPSDEDRTPPTSQPERSANTPRKVRERSLQDSTEKEKRETEPETEIEIDSTPSGVAPAPLRMVERTPVPKPAKTPNQWGQLIDKVRALDPEVELFGEAGRNGTRLRENASTLNLDLLAEAIVARAHGEWTTEYLDSVGGAVWAFIGELGKYVAWKREAERFARLRHIGEAQRQESPPLPAASSGRCHICTLKADVQARTPPWMHASTCAKYQPQEVSA